MRALTLLLPISLIFAQDAPLKNEVNFAEESPALMTAPELEIWARSRNLILVPDNPLRGLEDGLAAAIPPTGLTFHIQAPGRMNYLYLDLVRFFPGKGALPQVRWLDVFFNGELVETIYSGGALRTRHPTIIPVYPEYAASGMIAVELRPGAGEAFFAIWDAFISQHRLAFDKQN
ncbi:MAG: hypothetical protein HS115_18155 [Spirochaetales bacterium]|nr:hypothetical protein [Spirochaetales bacterium]